MVETARSIFARADIKLTIDEISSIPKKHRRPSLAKIDQLTGLTSGSTSNGQLNVFVVDKLTDNPDLLSDTDIADELNLMNKAPFAFGSLPTLTPQQVQILRLSPLVTNNGVR